MLPADRWSRRDAAALKAFVAEHGEAVLKPLDGMGGRSIFRVARRRAEPQRDPRDPDRTAAATWPWRRRYLPEIAQGDKRILLVDGEPVDYCLARIPQGDEFRGNLAAGGRGEGRPLSERDRWIAAQVGPEMKRRGMVFVGLDVIGDYLTEVNVTSPTCIRELDAQFGLNIAGMLFDAIEAPRRGGIAKRDRPSPQTARCPQSPPAPAAADRRQRAPRRDAGAVAARARHAGARRRLRAGRRRAGDADAGRDPDPDPDAR